MPYTELKQFVRTLSTVIQSDINILITYRSFNYYVWSSITWSTVAHIFYNHMNINFSSIYFSITINIQVRFVKNLVLYLDGDVAQPFHYFQRNESYEALSKLCFSTSTVLASVFSFYAKIFSALLWRTFTLLQQ